MLACHIKNLSNEFYVLSIQIMNVTLKVKSIKKGPWKEVCCFTICRPSCKDYIVSLFSRVIMLYDSLNYFVPMKLSLTIIQSSCANRMAVLLNIYMSLKYHKR